MTMFLIVKLMLFESKPSDIKCNTFVARVLFTLGTPYSIGSEICTQRSTFGAFAKSARVKRS